MKTRLLTLIIFSFLFYSGIQSQEVFELNDRAEDDIYFNSSQAIFYAENSIDNNKDLLDSVEYLRSLFILAKSYNRIEDYYRTTENINLILEQLRIKGYELLSSDFYIFATRFFYTNTNYAQLRLLLGNEFIISNLDNRGLIVFSILKNYLNLKQNLDIDFDNIEQSIALSQSNGYTDLEAELNILYGDSIVIDDVSKAKTYYKRALLITDSSSVPEAYLRLAKIDGSIEYLEQGLLESEKLDDNKLTKKILKQMYEAYKLRGDYKNLTVTIDKMKYFDDMNYTYIINQYKELYDFSYVKEKLKLELEESNAQRSLLMLIIISMGVAIIILLIMLSIQSYRLRGFNL